MHSMVVAVYLLLFIFGDRPQDLIDLPDSTEYNSFNVCALFFLFVLFLDVRMFQLCLLWLGERNGWLFIIIKKHIHKINGNLGFYRSTDWTCSLSFFWCSISEIQVEFCSGHMLTRFFQIYVKYRLLKCYYEYNEHKKRVCTTLYKTIWSFHKTVLNS